jgi:hypothetical protein
VPKEATEPAGSQETTATLGSLESQETRKARNRVRARSHRLHVVCASVYPRAPLDGCKPACEASRNQVEKQKFKFLKM